jgi:hypothetical protein
MSAPANASTPASTGFLWGLFGAKKPANATATAPVAPAAGGRRRGSKSRKSRSRKHRSRKDRSRSRKDRSRSRKDRNRK